MELTRTANAALPAGNISDGGIRGCFIGGHLRNSAQVSVSRVAYTVACLEACEACAVATLENGSPVT